MEKVVRVFDSFEAAEAADREYYRSLTPEQRLRILFDLVATHENGTDGPEDCLIRNKRAVGRPQDLADAARLEELG